MSNTTFRCSCSLGWEGDRCQNQINHCINVSCLNKGVCRSSLMNFTCECLENSYSGDHCEITANRIVIYQIISKSVASVAILVIVSTVVFIVIMDLLTYCFGIDLTGARKKSERRRRRVARRKKRHVPVVIRFTYVHASAASIAPKTKV